jgi:mRNA interferase HigB
MEVIGEDNLQDYARKHPNARSSLARWLKLVKEANWSTFQDVKATFPACDYTPQHQYCFDIGGNNYQLIATISFQLGTITILSLMTHVEYSKRT